MAIAVLKQGREKPVLNRHPWIFSRAIQRIEGDPKPGDMLTVINHNAMFLGRGYWNPASQIQIRLLTWEDEIIDSDWWRRMLSRALGRRATLPADQHAMRLVNAENDYLPGLIVDRYGDWLVMQALTLGIDIRKGEIAAILHDLTGLQNVYERSDIDVRAKEGLEPVRGPLLGDTPPDRLTVSVSAGIEMLVDLNSGHKTGKYLDQTENHRYLAQLIASQTAQSDTPQRVLNLFSYTGAFSLYAYLAHESQPPQVINVDSSHPALETAEQIAIHNGIAAEAIEYIQADVFDYLRDMAEAGEQYDVVILDPPKFAQSKQQINSASRGYKNINLNAFRVVRPGGYLLTFSCSGAIDADLFQKIVFGALADSGRQAQVVRHLEAAPDHPVALTFPEGAYLKGLLLRVE